MKNTFLGYYPPSESELAELWGNGLIALDANVLLNLYRYSPTTSTSLINTLRRFSDRLWIPHQAALEYQRNRRKVISQQHNAYNEIRKEIQTAQSKLSAHLNKFRRHPFIEAEKISKEFDEVFTNVSSQIDIYENSHPSLLKDDSIWPTITELFDGKVGAPYTLDRLNGIYKLGKQRYDNSEPPGFSDREKDGVQKYGDLIVWFQLIDKAKETQLPVIFVTDDRKEDWWHKFQGETIGPHPRLREEIFEESGILFYMYQTDKFLSYANQYFGDSKKDASVVEIAKIRQEDEEEIELERNFRSRDLYESYSMSQFLRLTGSMCKFALEQDDSLLYMDKAARRLGVTTNVVRLGVLWLKAKGLISIIESKNDNCLALSEGTGVSNDEETARLAILLSDKLDQIQNKYSVWHGAVDVTAEELFGSAS